MMSTPSSMGLKGTVSLLVVIPLFVSCNAQGKAVPTANPQQAANTVPNAVPDLAVVNSDSIASTGTDPAVSVARPGVARDAPTSSATAGTLPQQVPEPTPVPPKQLPGSSQPEQLTHSTDAGTKVTPPKTPPTPTVPPVAAQQQPGVATGAVSTTTPDGSAATPPATMLPQLDNNAAVPAPPAVPDAPPPIPQPTGGQGGAAGGQGGSAPPLQAPGAVRPAPPKLSTAAEAQDSAAGSVPPIPPPRAAGASTSVAPDAPPPTAAPTPGHQGAGGASTAAENPPRDPELQGTPPTGNPVATDTPPADAPAQGPNNPTPANDPAQEMRRDQGAGGQAADADKRQQLPAAAPPALPANADSGQAAGPATATGPGQARDRRRNRPAPPTPSPAIPSPSPAIPSPSPRAPSPSPVAAQPPQRCAVNLCIALDADQGRDDFPGAGVFLAALSDSLHQLSNRYDPAAADAPAALGKFVPPPRNSRVSVVQFGANATLLTQLPMSTRAAAAVWLESAMLALTINGLEVDLNKYVPPPNGTVALPANAGDALLKCATHLIRNGTLPKKVELLMKRGQPGRRLSQSAGTVIPTSLEVPPTPEEAVANVDLPMVVLLLTSRPISAPGAPPLSYAYSVMARAALSRLNVSVVTVGIRQNTNNTLLQAVSTTDERGIPLVWAAPSFMDLAGSASVVAEALCTAGWRGATAAPQPADEDSRPSSNAQLRPGQVPLDVDLNSMRRAVMEAYDESRTLVSNKTFLSFTEVLNNMVYTVANGTYSNWTDVMFPNLPKPSPSPSPTYLPSAPIGTAPPIPPLVPPGVPGTPQEPLVKIVQETQTLLPGSSAGSTSNQASVSAPAPSALDQIMPLAGNLTVNVTNAADNSTSVTTGASKEAGAQDTASSSADSDSTVGPQGDVGSGTPQRQDSTSSTGDTSGSGSQPSNVIAPLVNNRRTP